MKNFLFVFILFSVLILSVSGQNAYQKKVYLKSGYFVPFKESFRKNYDQNLFISGANFPISFGAGFNIQFKSNAFIFIEAQRIQNELSENNDVHLSQMPFSIGVKYYLSDKELFGKFIPYFSGNFNFFWSYLTSEFGKTDNYGNSLGISTSRDHYIGYGFGVHSGIEYLSKNSFVWGIDMNADSNNCGDIEKGGLGNTGGFQISLFLGIKL